MLPTELPESRVQTLSSPLHGLGLRLQEHGDTPLQGLKPFKALGTSSPRTFNT